MESCGSTHNQEENTPSHTNEESSKLFGKSQFLKSNLNLTANSVKVSSERQHGIAAQQAIEGMNGQEREGKRLKVELKRDTQELLTLPEDELGRVLEGSGRARMVWNMLRQGQDPLQGAVCVLKSKEKILVQTKPGATSTFRQKPTALERIMLEAQGLDPDAHATQEFCMGPKAAEKLRTSGLTMPRAQIKEQVYLLYLLY
jgi:hypothetical protein